MAKGKVVLVGAGPGEPGLLTVKAKRAIEAADAIVYDRLVSPRLLAYAKRDVELIYAGKTADVHVLEQSDIEALLVELASDGRNVVRLKGGDPFVFGRGGEEAHTLHQVGIEWEVVPGITSAVAVPAYAGIPVTYRNVSTSFQVVTGHRSEDNRVDWDAFAKSTGTLVVLMGVSQLQDIVAGLLEAGQSPDTPVALIRWGTRASQETMTGTLADIVQQVKRKRFSAPAVIVVGEVVRERNALQWAELRPLHNRRILVRASSTDEALRYAEIAERLGAETYVVSVEQFAAAAPLELDLVISSMTDGGSSAPTACLFRTAYGVNRFFERLHSARIDVRMLHGVSFCAVDAVVARALEQHGVFADAVGSSALRNIRALTWWNEMPLEEERSMANHRQSHISQGSFIYDFSPFRKRSDARSHGRMSWLDVAHMWMKDGVDGVWHIGADITWPTLVGLHLSTTVPVIQTVTPLEQLDEPAVLAELSSLLWSDQATAVSAR